MTYNRFQQTRLSFIENKGFSPKRNYVFPGISHVIDCGFENFLGNFLVPLWLSDYVVLLCHLKVNIFSMYPVCVQLLQLHKYAFVHLCMSHLSLRKDFQV